MECKFTINQKVVCIRDFFAESGWDCIPNKPVLNGIYTIRTIEIRPFRLIISQTIKDYVSIHLKEIHNEIKNWPLANGSFQKWEQGFPYTSFKPLDENTTDISVFEEILNKTTTKIKTPENV